VPPQGG